VDGKKTVWCAQHDETTLAPAPARTYEKISLSGSESVGIVRYLMRLENPTPEISAAINAAVAWFGQAKLTGIKVIEQRDESFPRGFDRVVISDEKAAPLWARFYDIRTNRPIFCGRDGIIKSSLAQIEHERRVGYSWYTNAPAELLDNEYPAWQAKQRRTNVERLK
jgi:PelA/Pel-15E family pectate lyase